MERYEIRVFETESGDAPFQEWIENLKDTKARTILLARIARAAGGNFGDWKAIVGARGLCEMRIQYAQGFRISYTIVGREIVFCWPVQQNRSRIKPKRKQRNILLTTTGG